MGPRSDFFTVSQSEALTRASHRLEPEAQVQGNSHTPSAQMLRNARGDPRGSGVPSSLVLFSFP